jgi:hypothetical protein
MDQCERTGAKRIGLFMTDAGESKITKEQDFKNRLVTVISDLKDAGIKDPHAMWILGSMVAELIDRVQARSWSEYKNSMTQPIYTGLLKMFQEQGNALFSQGQVKPAYAMQALSLSVVAKTQVDPQVKDGEKILDQAIETALMFYRKTQKNPTP